MELVRAKYFGLGVLTTMLATLALALALVHSYLARGWRLSLQPPRPDAATDGVRIGPWGRLETVELPFANPGGVFPDRTERLQPARWFFEGASEARVRRFLKTCGLSRPQRRALLHWANWSVISNGCVIAPPPPLIWFLPSASRQQIYSILALSRANYAQWFPFRFPPGRFDALFASSGLEADEVQRIRRLAYTNAGCVCFADLQAVRGALSPEAFNRLVEVLYRIPAYALRLHATPGCNTEALVKYWGRGGREKLIAPLLKSLARVPGGAAINVSCFLPPFARLRLYTFPDAWNDPTASRQDCAFTAMNFFNATPDTNFLAPGYTQRVLASDYTPVSGPPAFGDLVCLLDAGGAGRHLCVYIAADFVFTKNGLNPAAPWVLMDLRDVLATYYPRHKAGSVLFFRRKDFG